MAVKVVGTEDKTTYLRLVNSHESVELEIVRQDGILLGTICTVREGADGLYLDLHTYLRDDLIQKGKDGAIHTQVDVPF